MRLPILAMVTNVTGISTAAGMVVALAIRDEAGEALGQKLEAIGFGFLVPIFFISVGMPFDLTALWSGPSAPIQVMILLSLFILVRGVPLVAYPGGVAGWGEAAVCPVFSDGVATDRYELRDWCLVRSDERGSGRGVGRCPDDLGAVISRPGGTIGTHDIGWFRGVIIPASWRVARHPHGARHGTAGRRRLPTPCVTVGAGSRVTQP